jgi:hypothetical protein
MAVFGKRWSKEELDVLSVSDDIEELVKKLPDRTKGAIKAKILQLSQDPEPKAAFPPWTRVEIDQFPTERRVDKTILTALAGKLGRDKSNLWRKLKSLGYVWVKSEALSEPTDDNPYPMHGLKWTGEELAHFPEDKEVTKEILDEVAAKIPLRKPSSIWPKMKKEGYIWIAPEEPAKPVVEQVVEETLTEDEKYVLSLAHELGFRTSHNKKSPNIEPGLEDKYGCKDRIATNFNLPADFTSGELFYAIGQRITPFPWDMEHQEEIAKAYRDRDRKSILEAAKALHQTLEEFING